MYNMYIFISCLHIEVKLSAWSALLLEWRSRDCSRWLVRIVLFHSIFFMAHCMRMVHRLHYVALFSFRRNVFDLSFANRRQPNS